MANKKYNEFPAGTYDTNKIILQADPSSGALEKVYLPEPLPFNFYDGLIQIDGTGAVTVISSYSSLGTIELTTLSTGLYQITSSDAFTTGKTTIAITFNTCTPEFVYPYILSMSAGSIIFSAKTISSGNQDYARLINIFIRVYP